MKQSTKICSFFLVVNITHWIAVVTPRFTASLFLFTHSLDVPLFLTESTVLIFKSTGLQRMILTTSETWLGILVVGMLPVLSRLSMFSLFKFMDCAGISFTSKRVGLFISGFHGVCNIDSKFPRQILLGQQFLLNGSVFQATNKMISQCLSKETIELTLLCVFL